MKKVFYIILFSFVAFACTKNEVEEFEDFSGNSGTFTDPRDGQAYKWLRIGNQIWMAENLAFLPVVHQPSNGSNIEPRYYIYGFDDIDIAAGKNSENYINLGVLYNWPAAISASPPGWHLPSDEEWKELELSLEMIQEQLDQTGWRGDEQGMFLKATETWNQNGNGTNTSGFTALSGGLRGTSEGFYNLQIGGYWWSSTESTSELAWYRALYWSLPKISRYYNNKDYGFSIRCVKDS